MTETALAIPNNQVQQLAHEFVLAYVSEETRRAYWQDFTNLLNFTGQRFPTRGDVIAWRDSMIQGGLGPSTIARRLSVARRFFAFLNRQGVIDRSPAEDVRSQPVSQEGKTPALTVEEAQALIAQPDLNTSKGWRDFALLNLLVRTGLRRQEAADLTCASIEESNGYHILRVMGKGGKERTLRLTEEALQPVNLWLRVGNLTGGDPLFPAWDGKGAGRLSHPLRHLSGAAVWNLVTAYANQAGLNGKRISPHCLRATFTTLAIEGGAPVHRTSHDLGHTDLKTTTRYYRAFDELRDAATTYIRLEGRDDQNKDTTTTTGPTE